MRPQSVYPQCNYLGRVSLVYAKASLREVMGLRPEHIQYVGLMKSSQANKTYTGIMRLEVFSIGMYSLYWISGY